MFCLAAWRIAGSRLIHYLATPIAPALTPIGNCMRGRSSRKGPRVTEKLKSPRAASIPASFPPRPWKRGTCPAFFLSEKWSTSPASSAASTSSGPGRPDFAPVKRCEEFRETMRYLDAVVPRRLRPDNPQSPTIETEHFPCSSVLAAISTSVPVFHHYAAKILADVRHALLIAERMRCPPTTQAPTPRAGNGNAVAGC